MSSAGIADMASATLFFAGWVVCIAGVSFSIDGLMAGGIALMLAGIVSGAIGLVKE